MAAVKTKLGRIPCFCCGHPTLVKINEKETLTMQCDECDVSAFAKKGTACATKWRALLPKAESAAVPESVPKPAPKPKPAAAPAQAPGGVPKVAHPFDPMAFFHKDKAA